MLDSRQRDELNELIKYFSTRVAWFRLGLFISSLVQFATNGEIFAIYRTVVTPNKGQYIFGKTGPNKGIHT